MVEGILGSPEFQSSPLDPTLFVRDLYIDVLGCQGQAAEATAWEVVLSSGASQEAIIDGFVESLEADKQMVQSDYQSFLHRLRRLGASDGWVNMLQAGGAASDVATGILVSPESAEKMTTPADEFTWRSERFRDQSCRRWRPDFRFDRAEREIAASRRQRDDSVGVPSIFTTRSRPVSRRSLLGRNHD